METQYFRIATVKLVCFLFALSTATLVAGGQPLSNERGTPGSQSTMPTEPGNGEASVTKKESDTLCVSITELGTGNPIFGNSNLGKDLAPFGSNDNNKSNRLFPGSNLGTGIEQQSDCAHMTCSGCDTFGCTSPCYEYYCLTPVCKNHITGVCMPKSCQQPCSP